MGRRVDTEPRREAMVGPRWRREGLWLLDAAGAQSYLEALRLVALEANERRRRDARTSTVNGGRSFGVGSVRVWLCGARVGCWRMVHAGRRRTGVVEASPNQPTAAAG